MGSIPRRESAENVENRSRCEDAAADAAVDARLDESSKFDVENTARFNPTIKGIVSEAHNFF